MSDTLTYARSTADEPRQYTPHSYSHPNRARLPSTGSLPRSKLAVPGGHPLGVTPRFEQGIPRRAVHVGRRRQVAAHAVLVRGRRVG